jgi:superfamily I DNA/RNA helicase
MKKAILIFTLLSLTQGAFASECRQFFKEITKAAMSGSKNLVDVSFKSSNAISEYKTRALGPGPGVDAQLKYQMAIYNSDKKLAQAYKGYQDEISQEIIKHSNCFTKEELQEILNQ